MSRRPKGDRVRGPYDLGPKWRPLSRWRVDVVAEGESTGDRSYFASEEEALEYIRLTREELGITQERSIEDAVGAYETHMRDKGNKPKSYQETVRRLRLFFAAGRRGPLRNLTPARCQGYYDALRSKRIGKTDTNPGRPISVDTHRNMLAEAKTFGAWCVRQGWLQFNPLAGVEGVGKRSKGKPQLRLDESRRWLDKALELADKKESDGPVAAMLTFLLGMRCGEVVDRVVRDVDDGGRLLWIPDSKTPKGRRKLEVPDVLVPYLRELAAGRPAEERLFSASDRAWPRKWVQRICKRSGVLVVSAHGLRGTHATLATDSGTTGHVLAAALGHESESTTYGNYASRESQSKASQGRFFKVLEGGRP